jgi:hypothetical protein
MLVGRASLILIDEVKVSLCNVFKYLMKLGLTLMHNLYRI